MIRLTRPACLLLIVLACRSSTGTESSADETEAVASRVQAYVAAFNRRDIDVCAKHWSDER